MKRRCSWASSEATTSARLLVCMSSHGEISASARPNSNPSNTSIAHSVCIHVVPLFAGALMTMLSARNGNPSHRALSSTRVRYRTRSLTTPPCYLPRIQAMAAAPSLPHDIYESIQCAAVATASLRLVLLLHRRRICTPARRLVNRPGPSRPAACEDSRTPGKPNYNRSTRLWLEARPRRTHLLSPGPPLVPDAGGARERHRQSASPDHGSTEADAAARQEPRNSCPPQCYAPGRECADPKSMPQRC